MAIELEPAAYGQFLRRARGGGPATRCQACAYVVVAAAGVTDGMLLNGVRRLDEGAVTQSLDHALAQPDGAADRDRAQPEEARKLQSGQAGSAASLAGAG